MMQHKISVLEPLRDALRHEGFTGTGAIEEKKHVVITLEKRFEFSNKCLLR